MSSTPSVGQSQVAWPAWHAELYRWNEDAQSCLFSPLNQENTCYLLLDVAKRIVLFVPIILAALFEYTARCCIQCSTGSPFKPGVRHTKGIDFTKTYRVNDLEVIDSTKGKGAVIVASGDNRPVIQNQVTWPVWHSELYQWNESNQSCLFSPLNQESACDLVLDVAKRIVLFVPIILVALFEYTVRCCIQWSTGSSFKPDSFTKTNDLEIIDLKKEGDIAVATNEKNKYVCIYVHKNDRLFPVVWQHSHDISTGYHESFGTFDVYFLEPYEWDFSNKDGTLAIYFRESVAIAFDEQHPHILRFSGRMNKTLYVDTNRLYVYGWSGEQGFYSYDYLPEALPLDQQIKKLVSVIFDQSVVPDLMAFSPSTGLVFAALNGNYHFAYPTTRLQSIPKSAYDWRTRDQAGYRPGWLNQSIGCVRYPFFFFWEKEQGRITNVMFQSHQGEVISFETLTHAVEQELYPPLEGMPQVLINIIKSYFFPSLPYTDPVQNA